jgi:hypothetical protein
MTYDEIRAMPVVVSDDTPNCHRWHESVLRGYQILQKVKWLLESGASSAVIMELIELMETPLPLPKLARVSGETNK